MSIQQNPKITEPVMVTWDCYTDDYQCFIDGKVYRFGREVFVSEGFADKQEVLKLAVAA